MKRHRQNKLNLLAVARLAALLLACCCMVGWTCARTATAQESIALRASRGKQIYVQGTSASGNDVLAYIGAASLEVPGSAMACANCHGLDGHGKPEAGIIPSDLTLEALTKPYGITHADGRKHPPYTERGLELAITRGVDPAGNKLQNVMPRYVMSKADLGDLIFYLKRVGIDPDPGISADKIVIGAMVPVKGALGETGQAVKAITTAYFAEINAQGGIYNRRIELKYIESGDTPEEARTNATQLIKSEKIFAMTGTVIAGAEQEIATLMHDQEVPLIGPVTLRPQTELPLNRQVFYLLPGINEQSRALVEFISGDPDLNKQGVAIVVPKDEMNSKLVATVSEQRKKDGLSVPQIFDYTAEANWLAETISQLKLSKRNVVFFFGSNVNIQLFLTEAANSHWFPYIFLSSANLGADLFNMPIGFSERIFFTVPSSPANQSAAGSAEVHALAEKYKLSQRNYPAQITALSAAKILVEALRRVGRDLSREKLIQVLEGFYEYQTGFLPAITFGPNRRVGALGAYVVTVDLKTKQFVPASAWININ